MIHIEFSAEWRFLRTINIGNLSEKEIGYLIGMINGDGYFYYEPNYRHYTVEFYLNSDKDRDVQEFLIHLLKKINVIINIKKDKRFCCNRLRIRSKELFIFISNTDKLKETENFKAGFISGMIDSDGEVLIRKKTVRIVNTNRKLIRKIVKYLNDMKMEARPRVRTYKNNKNWSKLYRISIPTRFINNYSNSVKAKRINSGVEH